VTPAAWTAEQLDRIGAADELELAARAPDGTLRQPVTIWVVRVGDELFVRPWRGAGGGWYRAAEATHEAHSSAGGVDKDVTLADAGDDVNDAVDPEPAARSTAATRGTSSRWSPRSPSDDAQARARRQGSPLVTAQRPMAPPACPEQRAVT
jgi:hypothetical protein